LAGWPVEWQTNTKRISERWIIIRRLRLKDSLNPMVVITFDDVASQNSREWTEVGYVYIVIVDLPFSSLGRPLLD
jgi:hypothetical protein